jgi:hypothetical protein
MILKTVLILIFLFSSLITASENNKVSYGILVGDPIGLSLRIPLSEKTFLNFEGGIWSWHLWHDAEYNSVLIAADWGWFFNKKEESHFRFYSGLGLVYFPSDNPKDNNDYKNCAGIRIPIGVEYFLSDHVILGFEFTPFFQTFPPYSFRPYVADLNGGFHVRIF